MCIDTFRSLTEFKKDLNYVFISSRTALITFTELYKVYLGLRANRFAQLIEVERKYIMIYLRKEVYYGT
jgi:hypothetical protein